MRRKCDGIAILETFLKRNFDILTEDEKFRMYADLAYLCEDRGCMEEKAIDYLEKAIKINSKTLLKEFANKSKIVRELFLIDYHLNLTSNSSQGYHS